MLLTDRIHGNNVFPLKNVREFINMYDTVILVIKILRFGRDGCFFQ